MSDTNPIVSQDTIDCLAERRQVREAKGMSAMQLDDHYNPDGDGEHPHFTREKWRTEVSFQNTITGYWEWAYKKIDEYRR